MILANRSSVAKKCVDRCPDTTITKRDVEAGPTLRAFSAAPSREQQARVTTSLERLRTHEKPCGFTSTEQHVQPRPRLDTEAEPPRPLGSGTTITVVPQNTKLAALKLKSRRATRRSAAAQRAEAPPRDAPKRRGATSRSAAARRAEATPHDEPKHRRATRRSDAARRAAV